MSSPGEQQPWLSVVIPIHRARHWLDEALDSITSDPERPIAVIALDSTPEGPCESILERHRDRLAIHYEYQPDVPSWTKKTNMGVAIASSMHVCTLHQDDLWSPSRLETASRMIERHPDAALYLTAARIIDERGAKLGHWRPPFPFGVVRGADYRELLLVQNSIAMPSPIWKRDAYLDVGGMDETLWYTPDWDLWLKLGAAGPVVFDPEPSAAFRIHANSLTMTGDRNEMAHELETILSRHDSEDSRFRKLSRASVRVNTALADAAGGGVRAALSAVADIVRLGPVDAVRYLRYSRLIERVLPRMRLRLRGAL
ncbi:MAG: glycosyltransferase [Erythrobacter sp.]